MKLAKSKNSVLIDIDSLKGKLVIVKVGSEDRPASADDIKDMAKHMKKSLAGAKCRLLVTHHLIEIEVI